MVRRAHRGRCCGRGRRGGDRDRSGPDFDKAVDDSLELLRRLGELRSLGRPVFAAISRKDFLGAVVAGSWERRLPADERGPATAAARRSPPRRARRSCGCTTPRRSTRCGLRMRSSVDSAWRNVIASGADGGRLVATSFDAPREAVQVPLPPDIPEALAHGLRGRHRRPLRPPERGARRGRTGQRDRDFRNGLGEVALVQPAGPGAPGDRPQARALYLYPPRRSPRTRHGSCPSSGCRTCATRSTTETRHVRTGRGSGAVRT